MFRRSFAVGALVLLVIAVGGHVHAQTLLRWKFEPGQTLLVSVEQKTTSKTSGAGKSTAFDIAMQMGMTWKIESVEQGNAQITQTFDRLKMSMKSGKAEAIEYDSEANEPPRGAAANLAAGVAPLLGAKFTVSMTDRGSIREVTLPDETAEALDEVDSETAKQLFSVDSITKILRQSVVELPEAEVSKGKTWKTESQSKTPLGLLTQNRIYELMDTGDSVAKITVDSRLKLGESAAKVKLLDQEGSGTVSFDAQLGRLVKNEATQKLTTERPYREFKIKVVTTSSSVMTIDLP